MSIGFFEAEVSVANRALPVSGAKILVRDKSGQTMFEMISDRNGNTETMELECPNKANSLDPNATTNIYARYDVFVTAEGYNEMVIYNVQIFDGEIAQLPISMTPQLAYSPVELETIDIPPNALEQTVKNMHETSVTGRALSDVFIPEFVIVHLGSPNSVAENVRVSFIDYIKNVASSEIYPTWPQASLEANIYCQISLILNRVYTEWYRSKGYPFQITNSTAYDQAYAPGRNIFASISNTVDRIFNVYIRRTGRKDPFYAEYCNGTTSTCPGLSQWGTVPLAQQGLTPLSILKSYYPSDVQLVECNTFQALYESYPGSPLAQGMKSEDVRQMQKYLNRIRANFPLINEITPDGLYGPTTTSAVKTFQSTFTIPSDGIIGKGTWYAITNVYNAVKKLAELGSEGEYIGIGQTPPTTVLREGSKGELVVKLQFLLNAVADFYPKAQTVIENGTFDKSTKSAVVTFQTLFGLKADGIVGSGTWNKLYEVYNGIQQNVVFPPIGTPNPGKPYPGYVLKVGVTSADVKFMQESLNKIRAKYPQIPKVAEDGIFGNGTRAAVIIFQQLFGLTQDGIVGAATWNKIMLELSTLPDGVPTDPTYPGYLIRMGSSGSDVLIMQQYLQEIAKYYKQIPTLTPDGKFGNQTLASVKAFQSLFGLTPDGIIGQISWEAIVNQYNLAKDDALARQFNADAAQTGAFKTERFVAQQDNSQYAKQIMNFIILSKMFDIKS